VNHLVHDELADPEYGKRDRGAGHPQEKDPQDVARVRFPDHSEQLGEVPQGLEPLPPGDVGRRGHAAASVAANDGVLEGKGHPRKVSGVGG
jgi:hypothetical protein